MDETTNIMNLLECNVLDQKEIRKLIQDAHQGNINSRNKAVEHNIRLVYSIAKKYAVKFNLDYEDLFQVGIEGLIKAIERFDINAEYSFSTHATRWIKNYIDRDIENNSRTIRIPTYQFEKFTKINSFKQEYYKYNGCYPSVEEIKLNIKQDEIEELEKIGITPTSIDEFIYKETKSKQKEEVLLTDNSSFEEEIIENEYKNYILQTIINKNILNEREKNMLIDYFGLFNKESNSHQKLGSIYGITKSRSGQIINESIKKLKQYFVEEKENKHVRTRKDV